MRRVFLLLTAIAVACMALVPAAFGQSEPSDNAQILTAESGERYVAGEIVLAKKNGETKVVKVKDKSGKPQKDKGALEAKADELAEAEDVAEADVNTVYQAQYNPADPRFDDQYHLRQIGAPGAWDDERGDGVRMCVVDTGWDTNNDDLRPNISGQKDLTTGDNVANDEMGHGTGVTGIAAAQADNRNKVASVGFNANFYMAKAGGATGSFTTADIREALNWCGNQAGVSVLNMSFGGPGFNDVINNKVQELHVNGKTLVASGGNINNAQYPDPFVNYPAAYNNVIGVGATDPDGSIAAYSNRGDFIDVVAPGTNILSTTRGNGAGEVGSGTSLSSPQVAGAAALLRAKGLSQSQTETRIFQQSEERGPSGKDDTWGHGFLNVNCAVTPSEAGC